MEFEIFNGHLLIFRALGSRLRPLSPRSDSPATPQCFFKLPYRGIFELLKFQGKGRYYTGLVAGMYFGRPINNGP